MVKIKYPCPFCDSTNIAIKCCGDMKQYKVAFCVGCQRSPIKPSNASITSIGAIHEWNKTCQALVKNSKTNSNRRTYCYYN